MLPGGDNDVREGHVIKPRTSTRNQYWSKVDSVLAGKRELNLKTVDMALMLVKCLF